MRGLSSWRWARLAVPVAALLAGVGVSADVALAASPTAIKPLVGASGAVQISGTPVIPQVSASGWVQISSTANLLYVDQNWASYSSAHIELTTNVDLTGALWEPLGAELGVFNGQGYAITGLTLVSDTGNPLGFFGTVTGTVEDLSLTATVINTGEGVTGALVGDLAGGTLNHDTVTGDVQAEAYAGVLAGYAGQAKVRDSNASGSVTGEESGGAIGSAVSSTFSSVTVSAAVSGNSSVGTVGGLAGALFSATIVDVDASGPVSGPALWIGGLAGRAESSTVQQSQATGAVTNGRDAGGLIGLLEGGRIVGGDAMGTVTGVITDGGGLVGMTTGASVVQNSYAQGMVVGMDSASTSNVGGLIGYDSQGLLFTDHATGAVSNAGNAGGLVGWMGDGASAQTSYATGSVAGVANVGGLVGFLANAFLLESDASGAVSSTSTVAVLGGLVGYSQSGIIAASFASGNVAGAGPYNGGLVGESITSTVMQSYALGSVSGESEGSGNGGLVGYLQGGSVENAYAEGNVSGSDGSWNGGVVGRWYGAAISNTYETGSVSGTYDGGIAGDDLGGTPQNVASVFDTTTNPHLTAEGYPGGASPTDVVAASSNAMTMETTFTTANGLNWPFPGIWAESPSINQGFPYLVNNAPPAEPPAGQVPEVPWSGVLPLIGAGVAAWVARRTGVPR